MNKKKREKSYTLLNQVLDEYTERNSIKPGGEEEWIKQSIFVNNKKSNIGDFLKYS
jgi:hypothetical protein